MKEIKSKKKTERQSEGLEASVRQILDLRAARVRALAAKGGTSKKALSGLTRAKVEEAF